MPTFPSREWCEAAIKLVNEDPQSEVAGEGWEGDFGIVVDAEPGKLKTPFVAYCVPEKGKITRFKVLRDPDELDEFEPAYRVRAPYSFWKGLILGTVDPVEAVLRRKISMTGDLQPILERMRYKGIAERMMSKLQTEFVDEEKK